MKTRIWFAPLLLAATATGPLVGPWVAAALVGVLVGSSALWDWGERLLEEIDWSDR